jgi:hypothetical protein
MCNNILAMKIANFPHPKNILWRDYKSQVKRDPVWLWIRNTLKIFVVKSYRFQNVLKRHQNSLLECGVNFVLYKLMVSEEPKLSTFKTEIFHPEYKCSLFLETDGTLYQATRLTPHKSLFSHIRRKIYRQL